MLTDADRYQLLRALENNPHLSQRQLAAELGYSLGKLNYCLKALKEMGLLQAQTIPDQPRSSMYLYQLTEEGVREKVQAAKRCLDQKLLEKEKLDAVIQQLRQTIHDA